MLPSNSSPYKSNYATRRLLQLGSIALGLGSASIAGAQVLKAGPHEIPPAVNNSKLVGHVPSTQVFHVNLCFEPVNSAAMQAYVDEVSDPTSPMYRHFLTPAEIGQRFGQPTAVNLAIKYLRAKGLTITLVDADNLHVMADGTTAQVEAAFQTKVNRYHSLNPSERERVDYFAPATSPMLPSTFVSVVGHVSGLQNYYKPHPMSALTPVQTRTLYNTVPEFNHQMYGQGRTVGITNFDGFRLSNLPLWYSSYNLPAPSAGVGSNVTVVTIDGGSGSGTPSGEGDLDIQMALGQAPQCHLIDYDGGADDTDVLTREQSDNLADDISESYGWGFGTSDNPTVEAWHTLHVEMAAEGITYMNATGDNGVADLTVGYTYPDTEPNNLTVSGTSATVNSQGVRQSEVAWGDSNPGDLGGTGGWTDAAFSFNKLPSWQKGPGVPTNLNFRLVPDVALHAAGLEEVYSPAYYFVFNGVLAADGVGTSFASPVFAGSLAVAEQKIISLGGLPADSHGHQRYGRINDLFYRQNMRADVWFDVTQGSNGVLPNGQTSNAGTGWDFCTGLGAINFDAFVTAVSAPPVVVDPSSAAIYVDPTLGALGQGALGSAASLAAEDGSYFSIHSVTEAAGQTAAAVVGYTNLKVSPLYPSLLSLNLAMKAPQGSTVFIYEYTSSGTLNGTPVATYSMNGTDQSFVLTISNPAAVLMNGNQFKFVARALVPSRLGNSPFTLGIDEAVLTENF